MGSEKPTGDKEGKSEREVPDFGRWSERGFPHKGWVEYDTVDLGEVDAECEVCGTEIRYVHYLSHPDFRDHVGVGCVCAEHLTGDKATPRKRERALKGRADRLHRWLRKEWKPTASGYSLKHQGHRMTIFAGKYPPNAGRWGYYFGDQRSKVYFEDIREAKIACFEELEKVKGKQRQV